jgi:hypothetical protein
MTAATTDAISTADDRLAFEEWADTRRRPGAAAARRLARTRRRALDAVLAGRAPHEPLDPRRVAQYVTQVEPGPTNTYPPSWDATGQIITFIRDPNMFALNDYCKFRPATAMQGLYLYLDGDQGARVTNDAQFDWADGAERPKGQDQLAQFRYVPYICQRKDYPWVLGNLTLEQCPWQLQAAQGALVMQQAMTLRTMRVVAMLESAANWGDNTDDANDLNDGAGTWDLADTGNYAIRKTFNGVVLAVNESTNGMVKSRQLRCVVGPDLAKAMGESKEMADYIKNTPYAYEALKGKLAADNPNTEYNLPPVVYGVQIVIEDAVKVTSPKGATTVSKGRVKDRNSAVFGSMIDGLPGDQVGQFPTPNFSTFQIFHHGGLLKSMTWNDVRNERVEGHVTETFVEAMVAPAAGYLVTNTLSA